MSESNQPATQSRALIGMIAETPIHIGIGQVSGAIDLPVAREAVTGYPVLPASSLKGALRDKARWSEGGLEPKQAEAGDGANALQAKAKEEPSPRVKRDAIKVNRLFGPELVGGANDAAGAVLIGDGKLLLLPIRSFHKTFRWVTCPFVLARLNRDLAMAGLDAKWIDGPLSLRPATVTLVQSSHAQVFEAFVAPDVNAAGNAPSADIRLEEFLFRARENDALATLAENLSAFVPAGAPAVQEHLALIPDDAFAYFCRNALPARQRNALEKYSKRVDGGALWSEESVAADTVFYSLWVDRNGADPAVAELKEYFKGAPYLQVGGKETIGQGWLKLKTDVAFPSGATP